LPLVLVSRRLHSIIVRILHYRLLLAAALPEYKLILEAYHPSKRYTDPYLFCTYLGTDGLSSKLEGEGSLYVDCPGAEGRLAKLGALYSRFRPEKPSIEGTIPRRAFPAGGTPSQAHGGAASQPVYANGGDGGSNKVVHSLNFDGGELFTQFCAYASLVTLGPRRGVFLNTVHMVKDKAGWMRVWKDWLQARADELKTEEGTQLKQVASVSERESTVGEDKTILWQDHKRNIGLRVAVRDTQRRFTARSTDDDDLPMGFTIEIKGRWRGSTLSVPANLGALELVVRTTHLMLAVETSIEDQKNASGKAMIFGFTTRR
jgi:hypothetical protein